MNLILKHILFNGLLLFTWPKQFRKLSLLFLFFCLCPATVQANGAGMRGVNGSEIVIADTLPIKGLIVDEEVILDIGDHTVNVNYKIINTSSKQIDFFMIFPIDDEILHSRYNDWKGPEYPYPREKVLNFRVYLNGKSLPTEEVLIKNITLKGDYDKLKKGAIYSYKFPIQLKPGDNNLKVEYKMITSFAWGDGLGGARSYVYTIWSAKNWVSKFRKAVWRVFPPKDPESMHPFRSNVYHYREDLYTDEYDNKYKYSFNVKAPGTKTEYSDHIDFIANDFVPGGKISIRIDMDIIDDEYVGCDEAELEKCWTDALKLTLSTRQYMGGEKCYKIYDFENVSYEASKIMDGEHDFLAEGAPIDTVKCKRCLMKGYDFLTERTSYLRNEIFARKGYIFKSPKYKDFFEHIP